MKWPSLKELVQEGVKFERIVNGDVWYSTEDSGFPFVIPYDDLRGATFLPNDRGIFFMRWIRKALESE